MKAITRFFYGLVMIIAMLAISFIPIMINFIYMDIVESQKVDEHIQKIIMMVHKSERVMDSTIEDMLSKQMERMKKEEEIKTLKPLYEI